MWRKVVKDDDRRKTNNFFDEKFQGSEEVQTDYVNSSGVFPADDYVYTGFSLKTSQPPSSQSEASQTNILSETEGLMKIKEFS